MQAGFAMLETGFIPHSFGRNILFKVRTPARCAVSDWRCVQNLLDVCVCTICWWVCGYAFAFGRGDGFIGGADGSDYVLWGLLRLRGGMDAVARSADCAVASLGVANWAFQLMFATTAVTIVSGGIAQRAKLQAYLVSCAVLAALVYPVVVHWLWSADGWLSAGNPNSSVLGGALDFAGGCTVHMVGGVTALSGTLVLGFRNKFSMDRVKSPPRFEFVAGKWLVNEYEPASEALASLGAFLLWFAWLSFNAGSVGRAVVDDVSPLRMQLASLVVVNSLISPSIASLTMVLIGVTLRWRQHAAEARRSVTAQPKRKGLASVSDAINGILAGLVIITPAAGYVQPEVAFAMGILGGVVAKFGSQLLLRLRVDDPLDASVVHALCGACGIIALGFVADPGLVAITLPARGVAHGGLFYGGDGTLLAAEALAVVAVVAWVSGVTLPLFWLMRRFDQNRVQTWFTITTESTAQRLAFGVEGDYKPPNLTRTGPVANIESIAHTNDESSDDSYTSSNVRLKMSPLTRRTPSHMMSGSETGTDEKEAVERRFKRVRHRASQAQSVSPLASDDTDEGATEMQQRVHKLARQGSNGAKHRRAVRRRRSADVADLVRSRREEIESVHTDTSAEGDDASQKG
jgi:ammonium transporter, Amt family